MVSIDTLQVLIGKVRPADLAAALAWAAIPENCELIRVKWRECNEQD